MQRSRSHTELNNGTAGQEDEDEDDLEVIQVKNGTTTEDLDASSGFQIIIWYGAKKKIPLVNFSPATLFLGAPTNAAETIKKYHLTYKFVKTECRLVRSILQSHGFRESHPASSFFNIHWSGSPIKPCLYRTLTEFQKVNHFPRSFELTRKDRLFKNVQKMQYVKGVRHFDFVPSSFVLPSEMSDFQAAFLRERGTWIVKPVASSRGRGIYLINDPSHICLDDQCLVSKYIDNPLLVDGYKFDLRIYIVVTSFDPLRIYMFEEGLARFSTVKYDKKSSHLGNQWMHLTNYSVNKTNADYVRCEDPEVDDFGNKWSLSAMLRYLKEKGKDTEALMGKIEEVVVKAVLSAEMTIATGCRMFVPSRWNCFELFGFDVLVDENMKPWLLEVNLSPSLACDAPMDLKIKSSLVTDMFNLTGVIAQDPIMKPGRRGRDFRKPRALSAHPQESNLVSKAISQAKLNLGLTNEEMRLFRETKEEYKRRGGLVRIFPTPESWDLFGNLHEQQTRNNKMIHTRLFPDLWRVVSQRPSSATSLASSRSTDNLTYCKAKPLRSTVYGLCQHDRYLIFERKLESTTSFEQSNNKAKIKPNTKQEESNRKTSDAQYEVQLLDLANRSKVTRRRRRHSLTIQDIIDRGETMTTFQARHAFSTYLQRVQHRLLQDVNSSRQNGYRGPNRNRKEEEQLDLIMRFLRRASSNLSTPIDVTGSLDSSHPNDRRIALAKKLGEFVNVYTKDTSDLMEKEAIDDSSDQGSISDYDKGNISNEDFRVFLSSGSENELEELLTVFTKHNNSTIFLGQKLEESNSVSVSKGTRQNVVNTKDQKNNKVVSRVQDRNTSNQNWHEVLENSKESGVPLHSDKYSRRITPAKIYSSSVAASRPISARVLPEHAAAQITKTTTHKRNRSTSLNSAIKSSGHPHVVRENGKHTDIHSDLNGNDQMALAVGNALQRLLIKQSERNYMAAKSSYCIPTENSEPLSFHRFESHNRKRDDRSDDANRTFRTFVNFENIVSKNSNNNFIDVNSDERAMSTQTVDKCISRLGNGTNNASWDNIDIHHQAATGTNHSQYVSLAQYNARRKNLERIGNDVDIQPHPPSSKPPSIRKPIRTQKMVKLASSSEKD